MFHREMLSLEADLLQFILLQITQSAFTLIQDKWA